MESARFSFWQTRQRSCFVRFWKRIDGLGEQGAGEQKQGDLQKRRHDARFDVGASNHGADSFESAAMAGFNSFSMASGVSGPMRL